MSRACQCRPGPGPWGHADPGSGALTYHRTYRRPGARVPACGTAPCTSCSCTLQQSARPFMLARFVCRARVRAAVRLSSAVPDAAAAAATTAAPPGSPASASPAGDMSWLYDMIGEEPYTAPSSSAAAPEAQSHPELLLNPPPPVAVVSTMPTFVPLDAGSDRKALLSSLLTGLFMYHLRRLGPSDLVEFISTKTGTLGIGALSTKLETGIPQGADGFTTDDEAFSMLQQMLIRIVDRNSDLSTIGIEQVRGVAVEVVAEDTVEVSNMAGRHPAI